MVSSAGRSTRRWKQLRLEILDRSDVCHICGLPGSTTVDHYPVSRADAIARGRLDLLEDRANLKPAHLSCNSRRGRGRKPKPLGRTSRQW